eukprot:scaffold57_cov168-Amphora_coffeaeformis.AAC.4
MGVLERVVDPTLRDLSERIHKGLNLVRLSIRDGEDRVSVLVERMDNFHRRLGFRPVSITKVAQEGIEDMALLKILLVRDAVETADRFMAPRMDVLEEFRRHLNTIAIALTGSCLVVVLFTVRFSWSFRLSSLYDGRTSVAHINRAVRVRMDFDESELANPDRLLRRYTTTSRIITSLLMMMMM